MEFDPDDPLNFLDQNYLSQGSLPLFPSPQSFGDLSHLQCSGTMVNFPSQYTFPTSQNSESIDVCTDLTTMANFVGQNSGSIDVSTDLINMANCVDDVTHSFQNYNDDDLLLDRFSSDDAMSLDSFSGLDQQTPNDEQNKPTFQEHIMSSIEENGLDCTAEALLLNIDLKNKIIDILNKESQQQLKKCLKKSILSSSKKSRDYLFSLTPLKLCEELHSKAPLVFNLISFGLIGATSAEEVFEDRNKRNILAMIYGTIARHINRKASGYCLLLAIIVRDGGLREDTMQSM